MTDSYFEVKNGTLMGKTFQVYIHGNATVNSTINEQPVMGINEDFDVTVKAVPAALNTPPKINYLQKLIVLIAGKPSQVNVGIPIDQQLDPFYVSEMKQTNNEDTEDLPDWMEFQNKTISTLGVRFQVNPPIAEVGNIFTFEFTLQDKNREKPLKNKYEFTIEVVEKAIEEKVQKELVFVQQEFKKEFVTIGLNPPDIYGEFEITIDRYVKMPRNCTEWTSKNEGG